MHKQLEQEFAQKFIGNRNLDLLHDVKATPTTIKAWIDANFISRAELVETIEAKRADHVEEGKNKYHEKDEYWGCCECYEDKNYNFAIDEILSLISPKESKE